MNSAKKHLLLVDDIPQNIEMLKLSLEDDFNLSFCNSGPQALALISESIPDLVLLDVNMPDMTGFEVCEQIRKNELTKNLPVIFVTAVVSEDAVEEGYRVGGNEYITKPFMFNDLVSAIDKHLAQ